VFLVFFVIKVFCSLINFFLCLPPFFFFFFLMLSSKAYQLQQQELQRYRGNVVITPCKGCQHHGVAQKQQELQQHEHHQLMM